MRILKEWFKPYSVRFWIQFIAFFMIVIGALSLVRDGFLILKLNQSKAELAEINVVLKETQVKEDSLLDVNEEFYRINSDYVGWISIEGTPISFPIVRGDDNEYYLNHDFYQKSYEYGAIFMDYRNEIEFTDTHVAIYGHAARYQAMFGYLNQYLDSSFQKQHSRIQIQTKNGILQYEIFSVYVVDASTTSLDIPSQSSQAKDLIAFYQTQSSYPIDVSIEEATQVLSLVSCNYDVNDGRIIVQAILVP